MGRQHRRHITEVKKQEKELNRYHSKPFHKKVIYKIGKAAEKYDETLESLREKKEQLTKDLKTVKNIVVPRYEETKKELRSVVRPVAQYTQHTQRQLHRGVSLMPTYEGPTPQGGTLRERVYGMILEMYDYYASLGDRLPMSGYLSYLSKKWQLPLDDVIKSHNDYASRPPEIQTKFKQPAIRQHPVSREFGKISKTAQAAVKITPLRGGAPRYPNLRKSKFPTFFRGQHY